MKKMKPSQAPKMTGSAAGGIGRLEKTAMVGKADKGGKFNK